MADAGNHWTPEEDALFRSMTDASTSPEMMIFMVKPPRERLLPDLGAPFFAPVPCCGAGRVCHQ
jgi:hypothetical protein